MQDDEVRDLMYVVVLLACLVYRMLFLFKAYWKSVNDLRDADRRAGFEPELSAEAYLRVAFVTRSRVLRSEVTRAFRAARAGCADVLLPKDEGTIKGPPVSFLDIPPTSFPLFLTVREWLSTLDASLPGERFAHSEEDTAAGSLAGM